MKRPKVTLKAAVSLDGYLDDTSTERLILSSPEDTVAVKQLRLEHDAVFVGANTIRKDNPKFLEFNTRATLTQSGEIPCSAHFFQNANSLVFYTGAAPSNLPGNAEPIPLSSRDQISALLENLHARGVENLLVEGGASILASFLELGCYDLFRLSIAPILIGKQTAPRLFTNKLIQRLHLDHQEQIGDNAILWLKPTKTL